MQRDWTFRSDVSGGAVGGTSGSACSPLSQVAGTCIWPMSHWKKDGHMGSLGSCLLLRCSSSCKHRVCTGLTDRGPGRHMAVVIDFLLRGVGRRIPGTTLDGPTYFFSYVRICHIPRCCSKKIGCELSPTFEDLESRSKHGTQVLGAGLGSGTICIINTVSCETLNR